MSEVVRKAAMAAYEVRRQCLRDRGIHWPPWPRLPTKERALELDAQRAAIAATREPTDEMAYAGRAAWLADRARENPGPFTVEKIWRAMNDELLRDPTVTDDGSESD